MAKPRPDTISNQLREIIRSRGLTPYAVAQAAKVSPSVVTRFMNGERGLTLTTFDAIATALGLRLQQTAGGLRTAPKAGRPPSDES